MHVQHFGLVSLSVSALWSLAGRRADAALPAAIAADAPVVWVGGPPEDDDARAVWEALGGHRASFAALVDDLGERLFRRDLARIGGAAAVGFFRSFYSAYARELVRRLDGSQVRIGGGTAA